MMDMIVYFVHRSFLLSFHWFLGLFDLVYDPEGGGELDDSHEKYSRWHS